MCIRDRENRYYIYLDRNSMLKDYISQKNCRFVRLNTANAFLYEQYYLPKAAAKNKIDVLHGTDNTIPCMLPLYRGKTVVTIHDVMFIRPLGKSILKPTVKQRVVDAYNKLVVPMSAKKADRVITVSEYSRQDIIKHIKISEEKPAVIYEAADKKYRLIKNQKAIERVREKYKISGPYILMSAASDLRKNTARTIEAFNIFNNLTEYKYRLVITSISRKELMTTNVEKKIKELNLEKYVTITDYVNEDEMALLYNGAFIFLFPSIWEGFGLQVLESFACGLPVVTSDNTSLKEVAGNAAVFIDPYSVEDIVKGLVELEKSEAKRKELIEKGFERLKSFSWKKAAEETLNVYRQVNGR